MFTRCSTVKFKIFFPLFFLALVISLARQPIFAYNPPVAKSFSFPVNKTGMRVESGFNYGNYVKELINCKGKTTSTINKYHAGIDLIATSADPTNCSKVNNTVGQPVYSIATGIVSFAQENGYPGDKVVIEHKLSNGKKIYSAYGHIKMASNIKKGKPVSKGTIIGHIEKFKGLANPHLHFEMRSHIYKNNFGPSFGPGYVSSKSQLSTTGYVNPCKLLAKLGASVPASCFDNLFGHKSIIKSPKNATVYYITGGSQSKRAFVSEVSYLGRGYKWSQIKTIDDYIVKSIYRGSNITSNGMAIKSPNNATVYEMKKEKGYYYSNAQTYFKYHSSWGDVITLPKDVVDRIPIAGSMK